MRLEGLHHITAITADAPRNVDFYVRRLGLRMVKKTVNFDAPDVYHLYYGDERGTPGPIPTSFGSPRPRPPPPPPAAPASAARPDRSSPASSSPARGAGATATGCPTGSSGASDRRR